jgi:hypothetical protein
MKTGLLTKNSLSFVWNFKTTAFIYAVLLMFPCNAHMHHSPGEGNFCGEQGNALKPAIAQE